MLLELTWGRLREGRRQREGERRLHGLPLNNPLPISGPHAGVKITVGHRTFSERVRKRERGEIKRRRRRRALTSVRCMLL